jgi:hypothetical protein
MDLSQLEKLSQLCPNKEIIKIKTSPEDDFTQLNPLLNFRELKEIHCQAKYAWDIPFFMRLFENIKENKLEVFNYSRNCFYSGYETLGEFYKILFQKTNLIFFKRIVQK